MSRIGKNPIPVPDNIKVNVSENNVSVKGKLGELHQSIPSGISVAFEDKLITVTRRDDSKQQRAFHGLSRALIANMVLGVEKGFSKDLEIVGVGYRCELKGDAIQLAVGYSHRIVFVPPEGIKFTVSGNTKFSVYNCINDFNLNQSMI